MTEAEKAKPSVSRMESKYFKLVLVIVAGLLTFAAPTYLVYFLANGLDLSFTISMLSGLALFFIGLGLVWFLVRKEVIT